MYTNIEMIELEFRQTLVVIEGIRYECNSGFPPFPHFLDKYWQIPEFLKLNFAHILFLSRLRVSLLVSVHFAEFASSVLTSR